MPDTLAFASLNRPYVVTNVATTADSAEWAQWLAEIGFIEGEPVSVIARAALGGDPLVVRIGVSTFALRMAEAQCIHVREHQAAHQVVLQNAVQNTLPHATQSAAAATSKAM